MSLESLPRLWTAWRQSLANCPALEQVARPSLLPHLRQVDADQFQDVSHTMRLDGHDISDAQAAAALASRAPRAAGAGWPGVLPTPAPGTEPPRATADRAALGAYASALIHSRHAILSLLQGAEAVPALAAVYPAVRVRCLGMNQCEARGPSPDVPVMWDLVRDEPNWAMRAALMHLGTWRCEAPSRGAGRLARLIMNTVRAAAGHPWLLIPGNRRQAYDDAVRSALEEGDAGPWSVLIDEYSDATT